jgi:hypothetical protein
VKLPIQAAPVERHASSGLVPSLARPDQGVRPSYDCHTTVSCPTGYTPCPNATAPTWCCQNHEACSELCPYCVTGNAPSAVLFTRLD